MTYYAFTSLLLKDGWLSPAYVGIDAQGIIVSPDSTATSGPYIELKESIAGLIVIKANDYEEALKIAQGCPILEVGGNVEIRLGN